MTFRRTLEMSVTREEFLRLLTAAAPFEVDGDTAWWIEGDRRWTVRLVPLPERRLGSATLPRQRVEIVLEGCGEAEGEAFMMRFHRAFLRGGG